MVEGVARVLLLIYAHRRYSIESRKLGNRAYIYFFLAGVLGLDLAQSIAWLTLIYTDGQETFPEILLLLSTRIAIVTSGSLLRGTSTDLHAIRKDYLGERLSWWLVIVPSVLSDGISNLVISSTRHLGRPSRLAISLGSEDASRLDRNAYWRDGIVNLAGCAGLGTGE